MVERIIAAIQRARQLVQRAEQNPVPHLLQYPSGPFRSEFAHQPLENFIISRVVLRNHPVADHVEVQRYTGGEGDDGVEIVCNDGSMLKPSAAFLAKLARHGITVDRTIHFPRTSKKGQQLPKKVTQVSLFLTKGKEAVGSVHYSPQTRRAVLMLNRKHAEELTRKLLS